MSRSRHKFNLNVLAHSIDRVAAFQNDIETVRLGIEMIAIDRSLKASSTENHLRYGLQTVLDACVDVRNNVLGWNILVFQEDQCFRLASLLLK